MEYQIYIIKFCIIDSQLLF